MRKCVALIAIAMLAACKQSPATNAAEASNSTNSVNSVAPAAEPLSREAALKLMHDRHENMEKIGKATKAAVREIKGDAPDIAVIRTSAATIAGFAPQVKTWFPEGTGPDVGKTMAKAEIWQKPEDFVLKTHDFEQAAQAFDAAAKAGDMAVVKTSFGDLGKSCKACHDLYRTEHKH